MAAVSNPFSCSVSLTPSSLGPDFRCYHTRFCGWSLLIFLKHTNKFASVKELAYFKHRGSGLEWWRDPCIVTSASPGHWSLGGWAAFFRKSSDLGVVLCSEHPVKLIPYGICICCSVAQSCPTLCDPHELQLSRLPCPSQSPRVCSDSWLLSWWWHPTISSSVVPFSCLQSFPASGSFPVSWLFASCGQIIGASASVLPMNIQNWFPLGLISLLSKSLSRVFSSTTVQKHQFFRAQPSLWSNSTSIQYY